MKTIAKIITILLILLTVSIPAPAPAATTDQTPVRRYLISAGSNDGGSDRVILRYAVTDARAFASVFTDMGGVEKNNALVLSNPSGKELLRGIAGIGKLIADGKTAGGMGGEPQVRTEAFVYYSGHADESGLKLGGETLAWADLRNAVNNLGADVRVAVLDACGSGAITRTKGGVSRPAFLSDASSNMKGYAFLTSSNENEASQESDRLKGSYFTHALLSGMRGAADLSGDGRITINEAYQYAFNETLQSTQNTKAGTQHPSRDMNLAGTGDIVMTDLRETSAALTLAPDIEGRFFIRDRGGNLFAELRKSHGRTVELGMPPGKYPVQMEAPSKAWMAGEVEIAEGKKTALSMSGMRTMGRKEAAVARGGGDFDGEGAGRGWNAPVAISNIIDNGIFTAAVYCEIGGDAGTALSALYAGTPWLYALFEYQQPIGEAWPKSYGGGLGSRFGMKPPFFVNFDATWSNVHYSENQLRNIVNEAAAGQTGNGSFIGKGYTDALIKARLGANYAPLPYLTLSVGVSANALLFEYDVWEMRKTMRKIYSDGNGDEVAPGLTTNGTGADGRPLLKEYIIRVNKVRVWPSLYFGVTVGKIKASR
ncbi:MAG: caspase family protein [Chitinispirillales bacterium]|jgi:hypothetical protein|nr:caspase family protein [Chitinispirillales bacterium]